MLASSLASLARQRSSMAFQVDGGERARLAALAGEQDAASLEGFAHAGDSDLSSASPILSAPPQRWRSRGSPSASSSLPPGKNQRAGEGIDLVVAHHHETSSGESHVALVRRAHQRLLFAGRRLRRGRRGARRAGSFFSVISSCICGCQSVHTRRDTAWRVYCGSVHSAVEKDIMTTTTSDRGPHSLGDSLRALRAKWGWIVALGVIFMSRGESRWQRRRPPPPRRADRRDHDDHGRGGEIIAAFNGQGLGQVPVWMLLGVLYVRPA